MRWSLVILLLLVVSLAYAQPPAPPDLPGQDFEGIDQQENSRQVDGFSSTQEVSEEVEDEEGSSWILYFSFFILLLVLIVLLRSYFQHKKYLPVISYVKINKEKGFPDEAIRSSLKKGGWGKKDIEKCMKKAKH